jgi:hypothetical protein
MVDVVVLKNLGDVARYIERPEEHPAFKIFWNEAGTVGRVNYILAHPDSTLRESVATEVTECECKAARSRSSGWADIITACAQFRALATPSK